MEKRQADNALEREETCSRSSLKALSGHAGAGVVARRVYSGASTDSVMMGEENNSSFDGVLCVHRRKQQRWRWKKYQLHDVRRHLTLVGIFMLAVFGTVAESSFSATPRPDFGLYGFYGVDVPALNTSDATTVEVTVRMTFNGPAAFNLTTANADDAADLLLTASDVTAPVNGSVSVMYNISSEALVTTEACDWTEADSQIVQTNLSNLYMVATSDISVEESSACPSSNTLPTDNQRRRKRGRRRSLLAEMGSSIRRSFLSVLLSPVRLLILLEFVDVVKAEEVYTTMNGTAIANQIRGALPYELRAQNVSATPPAAYATLSIPLLASANSTTDAEIKQMVEGAVRTDSSLVRDLEALLDVSDLGFEVEVYRGDGMAIVNVIIPVDTGQDTSSSSSAPLLPLAPKRMKMSDGALVGIILGSCGVFFFIVLLIFLMQVPQRDPMAKFNLGGIVQQRLVQSESLRSKQPYSRPAAAYFAEEQYTQQQYAQEPSYQTNYDNPAYHSQQQYENQTAEAAYQYYYGGTGGGGGGGQPMAAESQSWMMSDNMTNYDQYAELLSQTIDPRSVSQEDVRLRTATQAGTDLLSQAQEAAGEDHLRRERASTQFGEELLKEATLAAAVDTPR